MAVLVGAVCDSLLLSCKGGVAPAEVIITLADTDSVYIDSFLVSGREVREEIERMYHHDHDTTPIITAIAMSTCGSTASGWIHLPILSWDFSLRWTAWDSRQRHSL